MGKDKVVWLAQNANRETTTLPKTKRIALTGSK